MKSIAQARVIVVAARMYKTLKTLLFVDNKTGLCEPSAPKKTGSL